MSPDNQLPFDEVKELLFYGIPNCYRKKLQEMDVDMTNCPNYATFIQRAERVEEAKRMDSNSNTTSTSASVPKKNKSSKSSNGKGKSYIRNEDSPSGNGTKNCIYHGMVNNTHSTDECKVMQAMAESKKSSSGNTTNSSSSYADKKKSNGKLYNKSVTKKEINALVAKTVRKELMAVSAARKKAAHEANNVEIAVDDPLAAELALDEELAGYDFSLLKEENGMKVDPSTSEETDEE